MKHRGMLTILVAVLLAGTLLTFLVAFQVRLNERAIVFRFGKAMRSIDQPGLYWKLPYPIETVGRYDTRVRVFETKFQEVFTADGQTLVVWVGVGWSIRDPIQFYQRVRVSQEAERQLEGIILSKGNAVIGRHQLAEFVSTDPKKLAFDEIEKEILTDIRRTPPEREEQNPEQQYGVELKFVRITKLGLPEKVTEKVFQRMRAERSRIAELHRSEGRTAAEQRRAQADQESEDLVSNAVAEATRLRSEGDAEAAKHYAVFAKNPELAIFQLKLEILRKLKERTTVLLDTRSAPFDLLRPDAPIPGGRAAEKKEPGTAPRGE